VAENIADRTRYF